VGSLDPDVAFDLLSNQRRRHVLCVLAERRTDLTVQELATAIVERLASEWAEESAVPVYQSVYVSLYQNHLPRLAEHDVVEYDAASRSVALVQSERTRQLLALLDAAPDRSWGPAYVAVAVLVTLAAVLSALGVIPTAGATWAVPVVVLGAGLLFVGALQYATRNHLSGLGVER
jgi:hypothetical protein